MESNIFGNPSQNTDKTSSDFKSNVKKLLLEILTSLICTVKNSGRICPKKMGKVSS